MPDYSKQTKIMYAMYHSASTNLLPYTMPEDGWLMITTNAYGEAYGARTILYLNGVEIDYAASGKSGAEDASNFTSLWPVKKDDVLSVRTLGYGNTYIYFMPYRK